MQKHYFNGQLILSSESDRMNFCVIDNVDQSQKSITDILDNIFNSSNFDNKLVRVLGKIYNSSETFNGMGNLLMCRDKSHAEGYCIGSLQLDLELFKHTDKFIEIILEDYTDFVFSEVRVKNEDAKSIVS